MITLKGRGALAKMIQGAKKEDCKLPLFLREIFLLFFIILLIAACAGQQYISKRQKEGENLLLEWKFDQSIAAFKTAIQEAEKGGDKREIAHLKSLLGWAYAESMRLEDGERETKETIRIAEANGVDAALFYSRLAVIDSKSMNTQEGIPAAEKALTLTAKKWRSRARTDDRDKIIDYAISHHGYPPDVDMIKTVVMAESSLSVLYLLQGDLQNTVESGERAIQHFDQLSSLMKLAQRGDKVEFFRGMGIAAAATSRAYGNLGNRPKEEAFNKLGKEAFKKIGVDVRDDDLLSAYAESGGYLSWARMTEGAFRPDPRFSPGFNKAEKLYFDGHLKEAILAYREIINAAKSQGNMEEAARALGQLGWLLAERGRYPEALRLMSEAVSAYSRGDFTSVTYARLSAIEGRLGNYERGLDDANKALDIIFKNREKMFAGKDKEAVIDAAMKNPGLPPDVLLMKAVTSAEGARTTIYYLKGDFKEAIKEGERAIGHFHNILKAVNLAPEREQLSYFEGLGFITLCVGDSYRSAGQIPKGREYLERAREYFKKGRLNYGDVIAEGLIGYSYVNEGNYKRGAGMFQTNLRRIESGGLEDLKWHIRSIFARSLYEQARQLEDKVKAIQAEKNVEKLLQLKGEMLEKNREKADVVNSLLGSNSGKKFNELLASLASANDQETAIRHLRLLVRFFKELSYENYQGALENIESLRAIMETDLNKRLFQANKKSIYDDFIHLSLELYGPEKGFEALERAKARSLMDLLATKEVIFQGGGGLRKEEATVREFFAEAQWKAREAERKSPDPQVPVRTAPELETAVGKYRDLMLKIKREEPELASLIQASYLSYGEIREILPPDATLLEYFLSDEKIIIWVLGQEGIAVQEVPLKKDELKEKVRSFREAIIARDREKVKVFSRELYNSLVRPVKNKISGRRLGIVPYNVLHYLPFHALDSGGRHLIEEYPIFYSPSASVLKYSLDKRRTRGEKLIAFGNPDLGDPAYDLPFAGKEVEGIAAIFPSAKIYLRKEASKEVAKKETGEYDIIHFACHAEFSDLDPLYSSIRLAEGQKGDGRLEAQEIFSLNLRPYLVTLSACRTGLGLVTSGDEIIGMNRAFIYAGAPSILSSLWSVSDVSTAKLMDSFYRNLRRMAKDEALQKAQVEMIRTREFAAPFFWAPFYLTGDWK